MLRAVQDMSRSKPVVRRRRVIADEPRKRASRPRKNPEPRVSLAQQAYEAIKLRIVSLDYRPGACLAETGVAQELALGRMPVREAIARLALEEMLDVMPRKGIVVRPVSLDEALANIEARLINEPAITRLAVERASAEEVAAISGLLRPVPRLIEQRDIRGLMLLDWQLHGAIARAARNAFLTQTLQRLHERSLRFWFISLSEPRHLIQVHQEHQVIVDAFERRDALAAQQAAIEHIESFRDTIKRSI
jgi:DNA-binding GntR family transcriptional regulator